MKALFPLGFALAALVSAPFPGAAQNAAPPVETGAAPAAPVQSPAPGAPPAAPKIDTPPSEDSRLAWHENYDTARQKAAAAGKDLLVVFTGADWIEMCKIFDRDILFQTNFTDVILPKFELVRLDFPKQTPQSAKLKSQNQLLMRAYRVTGFPTVILTDVEGRPYGVNGYQPLTPSKYAQIIDAMRQTRVIRDRFFEKAEAAAGVEKAKLLVQGIPNLPGNLPARYYRAQLDAVIANDPDNSTGKVTLYRRFIADVEYSDTMAKLSRNLEWSGMLETTDAYIRDNNLQGGERQQALFNKVGVYQKQSRLEDMVRTLLEIRKIDEKSPHAKRAQEVLDNLRANKLQQDLNIR
ncbi:MAG: thioredoxin family protein [Verrucomicrobiae bacterium]|nr:thioredoxin family protein [Verrucomicrobiae bacterium]MCP5539404.1 thioredoxin family protein [Akkermansiaceae bacterium]MCP5551080.1 thioredoxin family protein [Akkermansiaceae bacterium]